MTMYTLIVRANFQELSAKINRSIEQQVASAASSGKLTIMRNAALEGYAHINAGHRPQY